MPRPIIRVEPNGVSWLVKHGDDLRAAFPESARAVAFACNLADELGDDGLTPRIFVRLCVPQ